MSKILALRLLGEADRVMREGGVNPEGFCIPVLEAWLHAKPEHFARLGAAIGLPDVPPHVAAAFIQKLRDRVERRHPEYAAIMFQVSA